ncbi:karyopherin, partial [Kickxella alabastrina]
MDNAVTQRVLQALELVYGADTPIDQRRAAEVVCQQLKDDGEAPAYGLHLCTPANGYNATARHFGLQLLEHSIKQRWTGGKSKAKSQTQTKLTLDDGLQLRDRLWDLIALGCQANTMEPQYIREKQVTVMVMLIIRIWPSMHWTDLSAQLMHLYNMSEAHREMSLRIWRTLGEEMFVYDRDATATVRKHDLTNGIVGALLPTAVVAEMYPNGYRLTTDLPDPKAPGASASGKRAVAIMVEPGNDDGWLLRWIQHACEVAQQFGQQQSAEAQLVSLIDTVSTFMEWVPIKALAATQLVPRLAVLLHTSSDQVRLRVTNALEILSRRSSGVIDERDIVLHQFAQVEAGSALAAMAHAYASTLAPAVDDAWADAGEALATAKALALASSNLVTTHWARKKLEANNLAAPQLLLELLLALARDPRYTVAAQALNSWTAIIRHPTLNKLPAVVATFQTLTEHTTKTLFGVCHHAALVLKRGGVEAAGISDDEADLFESPADLRTFLNNEVRGRLLAIIRSMCNIDPAGFVGWIMPSLLPVFAPASPTPVVEAAFMIVDSILSTLDDFEQRALADGEGDSVMEQIAQARAPCYQLGHQVVQFATANTALVTRQLQTLPSFAFLLRPAAMAAGDEPRALLLTVLQKCVSHLKFNPAIGDVRELRAVARRSTATLVRLAVAIPNSLMLIYSDLSQLVQSRLADARVAGTVKGYLSEFQLALVAGASCSLPQRKEFARPIVQPIIDTLCEFTPAMQSPADFVSFLGLPVLDQACAAQGISPAARQELAAARDRRNRLSHVLATLQICLQRTLGYAAGGLSLVGVWSDYVEDLAPALLLLVRCLHALWNPAHWRPMPWQSAQAQSALFGVLEMSTAERQIIVSGAYDAAGDSTQTAAAADPLVTEARAVHNALGTFRDHAYRCLGRLMNLPELFNAARMPGLASNFTGCLFADAEALAPRHWRFLLTEVAKPALEAVGNWPGCAGADQGADAVAQFVPAWLAPLFDFCTQKLSDEWAVVLAGNQHATGDSVDDDIVREKMLRDWTRAWSHVISDLLTAVSLSFPDATRIEHDLMSSARVTLIASAPDAADNKHSVPANRALGAFILKSPSAMLAKTLTAALRVLQFAKDTQAATRVLAALSMLAPSLALVALVPQYMPPSPAHASTVSAYTSRIIPSSLGCETTSDALLSWLATDLVSTLVGLLCDPHLVDLQDHSLSALADVIYFSASMATRMPVQWSFRGSSGASETGDPGIALRQALLRALLQLIPQPLSAEELEQTIEQVAVEPEGKRRRALMRVALQPALAVEKSQMFGAEKNKPGKALSGPSANVSTSWT